MIFPWLAAQASVAVLAAGGAAGGFVSHVIRTYIVSGSKKDGQPGNSLDKAVVPILVEQDKAEKVERLDLRESRQARDTWDIDAATLAPPGITGDAPDPSSSEPQDVNKS